MPRRASEPLPEDLVARLREIPYEDLLRARLDPVVQVVFRGKVSHVHDHILAATSRVLLEIALAKTGGNASQAAEILGISRNTIARRANELAVPAGRRPRRRTEGKK
jgi:DNA-binding protein Fis